MVNDRDAHVFKSCDNSAGCQICKEGYNHWQCEWEPHRITEADHHYQNGHDDLLDLDENLSFVH